MKANGKDVIELIRIGEWAILEPRWADWKKQGSGITHLACEASWKRHSMNPAYLKCNECGLSMPESIVIVWLLLNSEKDVGKAYYARAAGSLV
ncbi:hypothetical protein LCGC14_0208260 [marine sediment metagenome]|uniref:Uncharacterized protein n=1 Tax=marine sediment metagenome TaxID=412755 RepID=A0A0F9UGK2_9ZZZZ